MPCVHEVKEILRAWFPGQEAGYSIADILVGGAGPSGRLPMTFPRTIEDTPAYRNSPGGFEEDGQARVRYEEGVFVGYRFYDHIPEQRENVLFPFGYGLSYSSFTLHDISLAMSKDHGSNHIEVRVSVSNVGKCRGTETIHMYVGRAYHSGQHPCKTLVAFAQVSLDAGETRETSLKLP